MKFFLRFTFIFVIIVIIISGISLGIIRVLESIPMLSRNANEENVKIYYAEDFNIEVIKSNFDYDGDGIDDYTDILEGAKIDAENKPKYKDGYYSGGYPPEDEGVCSDVIWRSLKNAGYSLKDMIDKDIKTSYNKVLAKAEAEIKIMYLTEDNRISTVTNRIPVVGFIDIQNVSEDNVCDTNFEIRNMVIKPNNAEEHSIYVELEAEVSCMAYEEKDINLIQDLYSPLEEISCSRKQITTISNKQNRMENCHVNGTVNLPDLGENGLIDGSCTPRITNINKLNSRVMYEGELETNFVFTNLNNQINTVTSNVPFEFAVDNIENGEMLNVSTNMEIGSQDFIVKSGGDVSIDVNVIFNMGMSKCENLEIIDNIELTQDLSMEDYSLIIYIVKKGDTLWNIAKKLNSTVDDIVRANEIEDENMINVGEKLYIPKYVKKGVAKQIERPVVANYA